MEYYFDSTLWALMALAALDAARRFVQARNQRTILKAQSIRARVRHVAQAVSEA
jgi:hypothetical protein